MLLDRKVILEKEFPLIVLEKHSINDSVFDFESARAELKKLVQEKADSANSWGYLPQFDDGSIDYSACKVLDSQLMNNFVKALDANFELTFIRLAIDEPISAFGGLHIDADKGADHIRTEAFDKEVVRLLMNFGEFPRKLQFCELLRDELISKGVAISKEKYTILDLKEGIDYVDIPPKEENVLWCLKFWASLVPHAGITNSKGHFMAAHGMYADPKAHTL